jgi:TonB family protein
LFLLFWPQAWAQDKPTIPQAGSLKTPSASAGNSVEILTPTEGVDFSLFISGLISKVKAKWYASMPKSVFDGEKGEASVILQIVANGNVGEVSLERSSGKDALDQAALSAVRDSGPFSPLPQGFKGPFVRLRFNFLYNLRPKPAANSPGADCELPGSGPPLDRLEFLAFASTNYDTDYEKKVVCQRGIDFEPTSTVLQIFRINHVEPELLDAVSKIKPGPTPVAQPDRDRAFTTLQLAIEDINGGQLAAADIDYKRSLQLVDDSASLHLAYANYLVKVHNPSEADRQARRSLELWPDNANAHVVLALALSLQQRDAEAVAEARKALLIFPEHAGAQVELGFALARSGVYAEAIPILRLAAIRARNLPVIHKSLGICLVHTRQFGEAIDELNMFLKASPKDAEAEYALGVALRETGKKDQALTHFREASRLAPENPLYSTMTTNSTDAANSTASKARPDEGVVSGNVYTNSFLGFSYQFPSGWKVLDPRKNELLDRIGGAAIANGDPILLDASEARARYTRPLLLVAKSATNEINPIPTMIQIEALDRSLTPDVKSGEEFAKSMAEALRGRGLALSAVGAAEKFSVGENSLWKLKLDFSAGQSTVHAAEVGMIGADYLLLFVFTSPDASKLDDLVGTLQSLRFKEAAR